MRFCFIDQIVSYEKGTGIKVRKGVSYAEPFLADHFAGAPVLPGAMMLEAAVEAATWFLRQERDFPFEDYSVEELRQGKFSRVVRPGDVLTADVNLDKKQENKDLFNFRVKGSCEGEKAFSARFNLRPVPLADRGIGKERREAVLQRQKELWSVLTTCMPGERGILVA